MFKSLLRDVDARMQSASGARFVVVLGMLPRDGNMCKGLGESFWYIISCLTYLAGGIFSQRAAFDIVVEIWQSFRLKPLRSRPILLKLLGGVTPPE